MMRHHRTSSRNSCRSYFLDLHCLFVLVLRSLCVQFGSLQPTFSFSFSFLPLNIPYSCKSLSLFSENIPLFFFFFRPMVDFCPLSCLSCLSCLFLHNVGRALMCKEKKKTRTRRIDQLDQFYVTICDKQFLETTPIRDNF